MLVVDEKGSILGVLPALLVFGISKVEAGAVDIGERLHEQTHVFDRLMVFHCSLGGNHGEKIFPKPLEVVGGGWVAAFSPDRAFQRKLHAVTGHVEDGQCVGIIEEELPLWSVRILAALPRQNLHCLQERLDVLFLERIVLEVFFGKAGEVQEKLGIVGSLNASICFFTTLSGSYRGKIRSLNTFSVMLRSS